MLYLALGGALLALYHWGFGGKLRLRGRGWRVGSAVAALAAFTGAAAAGVKGEWPITAVLLIAGLYFAGLTRRPPAAPRARPAPDSRMSVAEARRILGVAEGASREEVQAAYTRLMRAVHPDKGGTAGLAAQLNAARDRLLA